MRYPFKHLTQEETVAYMKQSLVYGYAVEMGEKAYTFADLLEFTLEQPEAIEAIDKAIQDICKGNYHQGCEAIQAAITGNDGTLTAYIDTLIKLHGND